MISVSPKAAMHDLMGVVCACDAAKERRRPFCLPCFQRLPRPLRRRLAGVGKSESMESDYPKTYTEALEALGLKSPFLKAEKLQAAGTAASTPAGKALSL